MDSDGCLICNSGLQYSENSFIAVCEFCKKSFDSNTKCSNGHFICDACHQSSGFEIIDHMCKNSKSTNPAELATLIMNSPKINMHGPEHHFLVPAVLLTAYYNKIGNPEMISEKLKIAKDRSKKILGGFCGFYGNCGAGVGTGIFMSIVLNCTPLSKNEWKLSNLMVSQSLHDIAMMGGPRCCKRDTYLSIEKALEFVHEHLNIKLDGYNILCNFSERNKECITKECKYHKNSL